MRRVGRSSRGFPTCLAVGALVLRAAAVAAAPEPDPTTLWQHSLAAQRFPDLRADGTLITTFPSGDKVTLRVRLLAMFQPDGVSRMALTRVTSNGALRDSSFLNVEHPQAPDDLWVYLPSVGSPRRLVSSNLADSYLGSEFRYGDLVQPDPDEYVVTLRGEEVIDGESCWVLDIAPRTPRLERDAGLRRQVLWLRHGSLVERRIEQYDRRGTLLKVIDVLRPFTDPASGKVFALERRLRNVQSGATSTAVFENVEVTQGMSADLFSPVHLGDRSW
jgi:hypothetical protein